MKQPNWKKIINATFYYIETTHDNSMLGIMKFLFVADFNNIRIVGEPLTYLNWYSLGKGKIQAPDFMDKLKNKDKCLGLKIKYKDDVIEAGEGSDLVYFKKEEYLLLKELTTEKIEQKNIDLSKHISNPRLLEFIKSSKTGVIDYAMAFKDDFTEKEISDAIFEQEHDIE